MKFSSLMFSMNCFASKLMGISTNAQHQIGGFTANGVVDGSNSFFETVGQMFKSFLVEYIYTLFDYLVKFFIVIAKWILVAIDFGFVFIREFIGMNSDYDNLTEMTEADMIFEFVFNETVINVIKGMIGLAIVLIIVFGIFAIVKSEYKYATEGGNNSKTPIFKNILKSFFLLIFVPVVAIGGIVMSNAILKSLYMATSGGTDVSIGSQIFIASGYNANVYRKYAMNDEKIPTTFNFKEISDTDNISGWGAADSSIKELDEALQDFTSSSVWNRGWTTFLMFETKGFMKMSTVDELDRLYTSQGLTDPYHEAYDKNLHTRAEEYLVMADVVEYILRNNRAVYFKTAQEIYDSYTKTLNKVPASAREKMIELNGREGLPIGRSGEDYIVNVKYTGDDDYTQYIHKRNETDESKGAVYLIAVEQTIEYEYEGRTYSENYYYPLISSEQNFATFYSNNCPVIAKGLFDESEKPTAIRQQQGVVKFYRDEMNIPTILDFFPTISYEKPPEGTTEDVRFWVLRKGVEAIAGVDVSQFIPYVYYNFDIWHLFSKRTYNVVELDDGRFYITYFMSKIFARFQNVSSGVNFENVYDYTSFNIVVLVIGSALVIKSILGIVFGLAIRTLDVMLLAISYPAVISTISIDGGNRFSNWKNMFTKKIVSVYGVVLGFNLVLLLIPEIYNLNLITPTMIKDSFNTTIVGFIVKNFDYGVEVATNVMNLYVETLFTMVALSMIGGITGTVDGIIGGEGGIQKDGDAVIKGVIEFPKKAGDYITGKKLKEEFIEMKGAMSRLIPGIGVVDYAKDKAEERREKNEARMEKMKTFGAPGAGMVTGAVDRYANMPMDKMREQQEEHSGAKARQEAAEMRNKRKAEEAGDGAEQTGELVKTKAQQEKATVQQTQVKTEEVESSKKAGEAAAKNSAGKAAEVGEGASSAVGAAGGAAGDAAAGASNSGDGSIVSDVIEVAQCMDQSMKQADAEVKQIEEKYKAQEEADKEAAKAAEKGSTTTTIENKKTTKTKKKKRKAKKLKKAKKLYDKFKKKKKKSSGNDSNSSQEQARRTSDESARIATEENSKQLEETTRISQQESKDSIKKTNNAQEMSKVADTTSDVANTVK